MRVAFVGGTNFVGPAAVRLLGEAGHEVAVAHSGAHEHDGLTAFEHLHATREALLAADGSIDRWRPDVLVDTFSGGASGKKAAQTLACADRNDAHIVAISSMDVYQHCVDAGLGDGTGVAAFPRHAIPLDESDLLRDGPYPGAATGHDNVAMEAVFHAARSAIALRPGAIYGPHAGAREWHFVERIARGERRLELPDGGGQVWHRVAIERVGRAIVAATANPQPGFWACNVVDPHDLTYAGLAARVAEILDWEWEPARVAFDAVDHPWHVAFPVLCSDRRLRDVLGVNAPDPDAALNETVQWLWENRDRLGHVPKAAGSADDGGPPTEDWPEWKSTPPP